MNTKKNYLYYDKWRKENLSGEVIELNENEFNQLEQLNTIESLTEPLNLRRYKEIPTEKHETILTQGLTPYRKNSYLTKENYSSLILFFFLASFLCLPFGAFNFFIGAYSTGGSQSLIGFLLLFLGVFLFPILSIVFLILRRYQQKIILIILVKDSNNNIIKEMIILAPLKISKNNKDRLKVASLDPLLTYYETKP